MAACGQNTNCTPWRSCLATTSWILGPAQGKPYVRPSLPAIATYKYYNYNNIITVK